MKEDNIYSERQDSIESFYEFHPEAFEGLSDGEIQALSEYFFVGREIDVEDINSHRKKLEKQNPEVKETALKAMAKVYKVLDVDTSDRDYIFDPSK